MNYDNLHELINRYEDKMDLLYGAEHYALFKWEAFKTWRDAWFRPDEFPSFGERFLLREKDWDGSWITAGCIQVRA